jgi:hypothetical protein
MRRRSMSVAGKEKIDLEPAASHLGLRICVVALLNPAMNAKRASISVPVIYLRMTIPWCPSCNADMQVRECYADKQSRLKRVLFACTICGRLEEQLVARLRSEAPPTSKSA